MNKDFTSVRMVYLLMAVVLLIGAVAESWEVIMFVVVMLFVGFFTGFCPSKWLFEKLGYKKVDL
jgi:predicted MFS family arabinose efflux permease